MSNSRTDNSRTKIEEEIEKQKKRMDNPRNKFAEKIEKRKQMNFKVIEFYLSEPNSSTLEILNIFSAQSKNNATSLKDDGTFSSIPEEKTSEEVITRLPNQSDTQKDSEDSIAVKKKTSSGFTKEVDRIENNANNKINSAPLNDDGTFSPIPEEKTSEEVVSYYRRGSHYA